jgi:hypothetical protein
MTLREPGCFGADESGRCAARPGGRLVPLPPPGRAHCPDAPTPSHIRVLDDLVPGSTGSMSDEEEIARDMPAELHGRGVDPALIEPDEGDEGDEGGEHEAGPPDKTA